MRNRFPCIKISDSNVEKSGCYERASTQNEPYPLLFLLVASRRKCIYTMSRLEWAKKTAPCRRVLVVPELLNIDVSAFDKERNLLVVSGCSL